MRGITLPGRSSVASIALLVGIAAVYFVAGKVGLDFFGKLHPSTSAVWPPTGVAIAGLLLFGYRVAGAVFVGAFLVNYTTSGGVLASLGIAVGNTLEGVVAVYLVNRFAHGPSTFERAVDVAKYAAFAAALSTVLSATTGIGVLTVAGLATQTQIGELWLTWWLGDATGAILVGSLLVLWFRDRDFAPLAARGVEAAFLFATVILLTAALFFEPPFRDYPLAYLCVPPLVWAAFRFRPREVITAAACMSVIATWATATGNGPFVMATPNESLVVSQAFTALITLTALMMSALVQERLALLQREQAALAESEAARRSSDVFLATLSHELRNPLSAIGAAGAVLEQCDTAADSIHRRVGEIIQRQTAHLKRLLEDLLDVSRIASGNMQLERQPLDLAECVAGALQSLEKEAPPIELDLHHAHIDADVDRIQQVVGNLLGNALKFTPATGHIRVRTFQDADDAVLCVEDNGAGIAAPVLPHVFDLFYRGERRGQGGLGVGLAIVRRIVELHGGSIEAHSRGEGFGSTFLVRLPSCAPTPRERKPPQPAAASAARRRILLIEDNADVRESLRIVLEGAGHEVAEAADGESGVERALALRPHLALVDIGLPGIDGCEVARRIRAMDASIRLVALTGYGREKDFAASRLAGFDAHLVKPVIVQKLAALIGELVDSGRRGPITAMLGA